MNDCHAVQVRRRREGGYGSYPDWVLALRVCCAEAHLALGQLEEAEAALQKLSGQFLGFHALTVHVCDRNGIIRHSEFALRKTSCNNGGLHVMVWGSRSAFGIVSTGDLKASIFDGSRPWQCQATGPVHRTRSHCQGCSGPPVCCAHACKGRPHGSAAIVDRHG